MPTLDELLQQQAALQQEAGQAAPAKPAPLGGFARGLVGMTAGQAGQNPAEAVLRVEAERQAPYKEALANKLQSVSTKIALQQKEEDSNPESGRSQIAQTAWLKAALPIAQQLKIDPKIMETYATGRSRLQLQTEKPYEAILQIAKMQKEKEKSSVAASNDYDKAANDVGKAAMAAVAGGRGTTQTVGRSVKRVQDAENMLQLLNRAMTTKDITPDSPLATELATGIASLLSGSNAPAESTIRHLIPKTAQGSLADMKQYVTGNPQQFITPGRMQQMKHTLERERAYWVHQRENFGKAYKASVSHHFKRFPELEKQFDATIESAVKEENPEASDNSPTVDTLIGKLK